MSSAYFMDVSPQYRDNGCPSQCMSMNEYSTVNNMYSFSTDPMTSLLAADPLQQMTPETVPSAFGIQDPNMNYKERYGSESSSVPTGLVYPVSGSIKGARFAMPPLEKEARLPSNVTGYGYTYEQKMVPQQFAQQQAKPINLSVNRR